MAKIDHDQPLADSVQDLANLVNNDTTLYMLFNSMLTEVPINYLFDPSGDPLNRIPATDHAEIRDLDTLFKALSSQIRSPIV